MTRVFSCARLLGPYVTNVPSSLLTFAFNKHTIKMSPYKLQQRKKEIS